MNKNPYFDLALSHVVRSRRESLRLTRTQLAERIGGSPSHLKAIEFGLRRPTLHVFILIARGLDTHPVELLVEVLKWEVFFQQKDQ